ncbi:MAG: hypothetical protein KAQ62_15330, partial [Cyclobacteriaceae bacterium]|nr:hypothetical protein [Cyclobacteriaceae bacterium]
MKRIFRILAWIFASVIALLIVISLLLLIPSIQKFVTTKATKVISEMANMKVEIGSIHIAFPKGIKIGDIFIEDPDADTLFFCNQIKIDTDLIPLIRQKINIDYLLIDGMKVNIYKKVSDSSFNFSPLIEVFTNTEKVKKESSESSWKIGFDELELKNIKAEYKNRIDSSGISLDLGHLLISANSIDVVTGNLDIDKIDLQETSLSLSIAQKAPNEKAGNSSRATFEIPFDINLKEINVEDIHFNLNSVNGKLALLAELKQAQLKPKKLDLKTFNVELENLSADGVNVTLQIMPPDSIDKLHQPALVDENIINSNFTFGDFPWNFFVNQAEITNTSYKMDLGPDERDMSGMDYRHMVFSDFKVLADSVYFNKNSTGANVRELHGREISGAELTHVAGKFTMNNQSIRAMDVSMITPKSSVKGTASIGYTSLREIGKYIEKLEINSDLNGYIHVSEIAPFTSILDQYPILTNFDQVDVKNFKINGSLDNLILENCHAGIGNTTILKANGVVQGLPSSDLNINFELDTLLTTSGGIMKIVPDTLLPDQITLPKVIGMSAVLKYLQDSMPASPAGGDFKAIMKTNIGYISTKAQLTGNELSSNFHIQSLDLGQLLNDSTYGGLTMDGQFTGVQSSGNYNVFKTELDIQSIDLFGNTYKSLQIEVGRKDDLFSLYSSIDDTVLSLTAKGEAMLRESSNHYTMDIQVHHADLKGMNFINEDFVISGNMDINTDFTSTDDIDGIFILSDIHLSNSVGDYQINEMKLISDIKKEYTNFNLTSDIFNSSLTGNTKIAELKTAFNNHINNYFAIPDSLLNEKEYHFDF